MTTRAASPRHGWDNVTVDVFTRPSQSNGSVVCIRGTFPGGRFFTLELDGAAAYDLCNRMIDAMEQHNHGDAA